MIAEKLQAVLGTTGFIVLKKFIKGKKIAFADDCLIIYRDGFEPLEFKLSEIEDFVNEHK